jgi:hypothetical protein
MKIYEQLMGGILDQVLEDIEEERVRQGRKRIVLNSTLPYAKIIEGMNKTWEEEFLEGKKLDEGVVLRIETMKGEEGKRKAIVLRNITIPLLIFMIEHQFYSTTGRDGEKTVWRQVTGISIGSSRSGILVKLYLLLEGDFITSA